MPPREGKGYWDTLGRELSSTVSQRPVYELLSHIAEATEDQDTYDMLVRLLVNTGRIELRRNRDPLRATVNRLERVGVLERAQPHGQLFALRPEYGWARAELRGMRRRREQ